MFKANSLKNLTTLFVGLITLLMTSQAMAGITIANTRVVYPVGTAEVSVQLNNNSSAPAMAQAWVDEGDANSSPSDSKAPFFIAPAIFRMAPNQSQMLRVVFTGKPLPVDRESLFWLNVLDVPPEAKTTANHLQFAFRTRIKLFIRPAGLVGSVKEAAGTLRWQAIPSKKGAMSVTNSSPYYLSFSEIDVQSQGKTLKNEGGGMVAPFSTTILTVQSQNALSSGSKVHYLAIGDLGEALPGSASLN
ncbi:TPA: molecular chaperone [Serratia fonticola]